MRFYPSLGIRAPSATRIGNETTVDDATHVPPRIRLTADNPFANATRSIGKVEKLEANQNALVTYCLSSAGARIGEVSNKDKAVMQIPRGAGSVWTRKRGISFHSFAHSIAARARARGQRLWGGVWGEH